MTKKQSGCFFLEHCTKVKMGNNNPYN